MKDLDTLPLGEKNTQKNTTLVSEITTNICICYLGFWLFFQCIIILHFTQLLSVFLAEWTEEPPLSLPSCRGDPPPPSGSGGG